MQPSEAIASRRGQMYRAHGVGGGPCGRLPLSTPWARYIWPLHALLVSTLTTCYNVIDEICDHYKKRKKYMDEQVVAGSEAHVDIAAFVARYPFPIDDFQLEAIAHLAADRSVMVAAPTGT